MRNDRVYPDNPILVVDDEQGILDAIRETLVFNGYNNVLTCSDSLQVMDLIASKTPRIVLLDLTMPYVGGMELLPQIAERHPEVAVIVITGTNEVDTAVECMRNGAYDYLVKAIEEDRLISALRKAVKLQELQDENRALKDKLFTQSLACPEAFQRIVSNSTEMLAIFRYVESVARTRHPVLITGETGTGKELIAEAVHRASGVQGEMVEVNVAGLDDNLFADTLFGHKKGAFTGAEGDRKGLIEQAAGSTLFLDEIGDLSIQSQIKLLRLLENDEYYPLGSDRKKKSRARIVLATNRPLKQLVSEETFRKDLYYRLSAYEIVIPPLRRRKDDIKLLFDTFLEQAAQEFCIDVPRYPQELFSLLTAYHFPGNVRELRSMVNRGVSMQSDGVLSITPFREMINENVHADSEIEWCAVRDREQSSLVFPGRLPTIKEATEAVIYEALDRAGGNQSAAARVLGITQQALSKRLSTMRREG